MSWGAIWQSKSRTELIKQRLATDPHSPNEFRCNQIVRNVDDFYAAFEVTEFDALWLDLRSASPSGELGPRAAYGSKFERLQQIKQDKYDPANVFHRNANIPPRVPEARGRKSLPARGTARGDENRPEESDPSAASTAAADSWVAFQRS